MTDQTVEVLMEQDQGVNVTQGINLDAPNVVNGISQTDADARYVQLSQIDAPGGLAKLDDQALVPLGKLSPLTIDLTLFFQNKLL